MRESTITCSVQMYVFTEVSLKVTSVLLFCVFRYRQTEESDIITLLQMVGKLWRWPSVALNMYKGFVKLQSETLAPRHQSCVFEVTEVTKHSTIFFCQWFDFENGTHSVNRLQSADLTIVVHFTGKRVLFSHTHTKRPHNITKGTANRKKITSCY